MADQPLRPRRVFGRGRRAIDEDAEQLDIPIHAFDLIIADECHRGYTAAEQSRLAQHARPLRRHQDRPDRHAGRPHQRRTSRTSSTATSTSGPSARATWSTTTSVDDQVQRPHERRLPQGRRAGRARRPRDRRRAARPAGGRAAVRHRRGRAQDHRRPTPTARSSKRSRSTPWSTSSATAASPRR